MLLIALAYQKKGWKVYCDREVPECYMFHTSDFGKILFPPNSLVLVDEVGLVWDNRNYKSFPEHVKVYFKYQRQYRNTAYLFSQSFDVDKKIRDLTDHLTLCPMCSTASLWPAGSPKRSQWCTLTTPPRGKVR